MGGLQSPKPEQDTGGSDAGAVRRKERRKTGVAGGAPEQSGLRVTITSYRRRLLDGDNFQGGAKLLRDEIAKTLGVDDGDPRIEFEYAQVKTVGPEGVCVTIHRI